MNGDQRRTTQNNIKKVIGSYDDFILTSLSSQIKNSVFIEKTQKEKKTLLAQFMGLEIFDKLWVSATEEIREVSAVLKNFKKNDWERDLADIKEQKEDFKKTHKKLLSEKDEIQSKKKLVESNIITLTKKLKPTDKSIGDITNLKDNKEVLTRTLSGIDNQLGEVISKTEKVNVLEKQIRLKIKYHEEQKTNEKFVEGEKLNTEHDRLTQELSKLKIEVRN